MTDTITITKPKTTDDTLSQWPPKAHLIRRKDMPATEGTIALCGAKLMGMDLDGDVLKGSCKECIAVAKSELGKMV